MTDAGQNVATLPAGGPLPALQIFETRPDQITLHAIWDYELDDLSGYSRPIVLAFAATLVGACLGLIPSFIGVIGTIGAGRAIDLGGLIVAVLWGGTLLGGSIAGFFAVQGQLDIRHLKAKIRARAAIQLNPPQSGASSSADASPSA